MKVAQNKGATFPLEQDFAAREQAAPVRIEIQPSPTDLLAWYDHHRRRLPWRAAPGERADPYRVWLSEIMLQQTTVRAVAPYYARFLDRFPSVERLAAAKLDDVLKLWAGLGYYARARHLHACAKAVLERHGGRFPASAAELAALPGIGPYTAAAVAAIAFDVRAAPVDGNIERLIARLHAVEDALPGAKAEIRRLAAALIPAQRPGDFVQAMMDVGATICTPKKPACSLCPWEMACAARARGDAESFPRKAPKIAGKLRRGAAFVVLRADGHLLVRTRPVKGLLGGMTEVPTSAWTHDFDFRNALCFAPSFSSPLPCGERSPAVAEGEGGRVRGTRPRQNAKPLPPHPVPLPNGEREKKLRGEKEKRLQRQSEILWHRLPGVVTHTFTHFPLELVVYAARVGAQTPAPAGMRWIKIVDLAGEALPNVMRKVIAHAISKAARTIDAVD